jgi:hypothetical protein
MPLCTRYKKGLRQCLSMYIFRWFQVNDKESCISFTLEYMYNVWCHHQQRFIESQDIPERENTFGLDGREAKFYMYIQSTTMERPDLERTMEQVFSMYIFRWFQVNDKESCISFTLEYMYNVWIAWQVAKVRKITRCCFWTRWKRGKVLYVYSKHNNGKARSREDHGASPSLWKEYYLKQDKLDLAFPLLCFEYTYRTLPLFHLVQKYSLFLVYLEIQWIVVDGDIKHYTYIPM